MTSLYVLAQEYRQVATELADLEIDEQTVNDTLEGLSGALEVKATNIAMMAKEMDYLADAVKAAEANMSARRKKLESRADSMRAYVKTAMEHAGISKIECPYFALSIRKNPPAVVIDSEALIPPEYMRTPEPPPPSPDKKAIGAALKEGKEVTGARLAIGTRLDIK